MNEDLDRLLAYRNFLAAEDHLDELLGGTVPHEMESYLMGVKNEIEYLRDDVMPKEANKDFHCLVKHVATAYEACREVAKATHYELDINRANATRDLLMSLLEKLWDRKVIKCERCKDATRGIQDEGAGSASEASDDGLSRGSVQGSSYHRGDVVFGREASDYPGDETIGIERAASYEEDGAPF